MSDELYINGVPLSRVRYTDSVLAPVPSVEVPKYKVGDIIQAPTEGGGTARLRVTKVHPGGRLDVEVVERT